MSPPAPPLGGHESPPGTRPGSVSARYRSHPKVQRHPGRGIPPRPATRSRPFEKRTELLVIHMIHIEPGGLIAACSAEAPPCGIELREAHSAFPTPADGPVENYSHDRVVGKSRGNCHADDTPRVASRTDAEPLVSYGDIAVEQQPHTTPRRSMSRMKKRIATVAILIATFVGAGSVVTAAPASAADAYKPDTCGDSCKFD
jgi:hypothetical protein